MMILLRILKSLKLSYYIILLHIFTFTYIQKMIQKNNIYIYIYNQIIIDKTLKVNKSCFNFYFCDFFHQIILICMGQNLEVDDFKKIIKVSKILTKTDFNKKKFQTKKRI